VVSAKDFLCGSGIISALAGLTSLPYLFMAMDELFDALGGHLQADTQMDPYAAVDSWVLVLWRILHGVSPPPNMLSRLNPRTDHEC